MLAKFLKSMFAGLAKLQVSRDEFGLTEPERANILRLASTSERSRDLAERVACTGFELSRRQFERLLMQHGLCAN